jgi:hypothetical protein
MKRIRIAIAALGVVCIGVGVLALVQTVRPTQWLDIAIWLGAALVLHDGVLVPLETALVLGLKAVGRRLPTSALLVIEGGFALGAILTLVVVPEIHAQQLGPKNTTILQGDYALALAIVWIVIAVVVAAGVAALTLRAGRTRRMSESRSTAA